MSVRLLSDYPQAGSYFSQLAHQSVMGARTAVTYGNITSALGPKADIENRAFDVR